ncbi:MAG: 4-hydroxy-tetrahydrodipicolinate synthase [Candidatus Marinamargulisbacteria bacterium]
MIEFGPIITAMVTPFNSDGTINYKQAVELMDYLIQNKSTGILLTGTTGESPTLSHTEEYELYKLAVQHFKGKVHLMAGTGSNCTKTAIESTQMAEELGMDSTLQVVPYYNKPCQNGIYNHFRAISDATQLPIMLYNIPGRTGVNMTADTVKKCSAISNIVALKEAAGDVDQMREFRHACPVDFHIYCGDDGLTLDFLSTGASGVVSVASHIAGEQLNNMISAFHAGDMSAARTIHHQLAPLCEALFITSNPIPVKAALKLIGFDCGSTRPPLMAISEDQHRQIETTLDAFFASI